MVSKAKAKSKPRKKSTPVFIPAITKEVMGVDELADYLGISDSTVYKWVQAREIPFTKLGVGLRFLKRHIDEWLARNTLFPDDRLYQEFALLQNRYHFRLWLEGRGIDWRPLTDDELADHARQALEDLRKNEGEGTA